MRQTLDALAKAAGAPFPRVARASDPRPDSGIESIPRVRLAALGIVMVPQVELDGHPVDGLIGERLVLQFDGFGPHSERKRRNRDLRQDVRLQRLGYIVLRFSYDQVMFEWDWVLSEILDVIAKGGQAC